MNRKECLDGAAAAVLQDRNVSYGPPEDTFERIAKIWSAVLDCDVTAAQVCLCLAGLKMARLAYNPSHADSWVDMAGYAACGAEIGTKDGAA